jgi:PAP2 superfamily protein
MRASILFSAVTAVLVACAEGQAPTGAVTESSNQGTETVGENAAVYWNGVARSLVAKYASSAPIAIRGYAIVALAQHNAAAVAGNLAVHAAVSSASSVALTYLYPAEQAALDSILHAYLNSTNPNPETVEGTGLGRTVGASIVAYAQTDRFLAPWSGTVPTGPGMWFSATPPVGAMFGQAKTFFLSTNSQFRPAPYPAFGSPEFQGALAEVRRISDTRTREQDSLAKFWNLPNGTYTPAGYWNEEAARLVTKYRLNERRAAHLFALMHMVAYDGLVASHESKYTYWLLRPTMADAGITLSIPLPNFPSYPSNHATISSGAATVLATQFPAERARLQQLAEQAALSRVYGGIHYRFDGTAGLTLGRRVAEWARDNDVELRTPFPLR